MFIHDTILDHIKCGVNEIEAGQIIIEIRQLSEKNKNGKTGFEEKFQVQIINCLLTKVSDIFLRCFSTGKKFPACVKGVSVLSVDGL